VSVLTDFRVDVRPYSGFDDPGLPVASWVAQGGVAGDASGGSVFMSFLFQRDDDAQISEMFNLEQISFDMSTITSREVALQTFNMDSLGGNRALSPQIWRFRTEGVAGPSISALDFESNLLPIWMGSPTRAEGDSGVRLTIVNVDLLLYAAVLQGYMWGPRSVLARGGPRRPPGGLFGE